MKKMKKIIPLTLLVIMLVGCTAQQRYLIPSNKTQSDFLTDREICYSSSGYTGGHFLIGPIIIIFPVAIVLEIIRMNRQKDFERCMVGKEYKCTEGCWNVTPAENETPKKQEEILQQSQEGKQI